MEFTRRQLEAIDITRFGQDMCVVAGPGSGKTTVLVERFRRLVEAGIPPLRILAITFTEKAATNMKQKLAEAFRGRPREHRELERAYVSTVHGFCMRLLRENAIFAGVDPEFRVLDERQSATLQGQAVKEALDATRLIDGLDGTQLAGALPDVYDAMRASGLARPPAPPVESQTFDDLLDLAGSLAGERPLQWTAKQREALAEIVSWSERYRTLRGRPAAIAHFAALGDFHCNLNRLRKGNAIYERARQIKQTVEEVYRRLLTDFYAPQRAELAELLARFDRLYRERKAAAAALDYADLEESTVRLLEENAEVRERIRGQFDQVLMDEFQDTNGLQKRLIELVRPPDRFYAVGDINQSIYGFRHAEPRVFREYRDEVERGGKPLAELTENWRSRAEILQAVTTVLQGAEGIEERPLIAAQQFPAKAEPCVEALVAIAENAEDALLLEARWVARRILDLEGSLALRGGPAGFGDFAVLVRNSEVMAAFTAAFDDAGIPYLVGRGKGFYEAQEITDLVHLLRVVVNPRDEVSMAAVLRSPLVGLSDEALYRLKQGDNLGAAVRLPPMTEFDAADGARLERFRANLRDWRAARDYTGFDRLLLAALDAGGYAHEPGSRAAANVERFLAIAREAADRLTLAEFVEELELVRVSDPRDADAPPEDSSHAVRILTVHAAKGLEFPVVFLAALHKGIDSNLGALSFSPRWGLGARWRNPVSGEEKDDWYQHRIREERKQREAQEANRLFYVAMTRAEEHLVLSHARTAAAAPKNWAARVETTLGIDAARLGDRAQPVRAPDSGEFPLLVRCVAKPPHLVARERGSGAREAAVELERPALSGQYDANATVTSVALFASCPRRYYLERYLGWNVPAQFEPAARAGRELPAAELGTQVHALLAGEPVEAPHPTAVELAGRFQATPLGRRAARATRVEREFDFLLALEEVVLRGQIDLWFEDRGELILVDYKTDAVVDADAYAEQLRLYALALERIAGRLPAAAYLCFLRAGETVPVDLSPLALHAAGALVRDFREAQDRLQFPTRPGEHCRRCPYAGNLCPAVLS